MSGWDQIKFSTGTVIDANCRIVGIDDELGTFEGCDGPLECLRTLTPAERRELADMMIARWQAYRQKHSK